LVQPLRDEKNILKNPMSCKVLWFNPLFKFKKQKTKETIVKVPALVQPPSDERKKIKITSNVMQGPIVGSLLWLKNYEIKMPM
jgi:hypothetical protein